MPVAPGKSIRMVLKAENSLFIITVVEFGGMMLSTSDFRKGMKLAVEGDLFIIVDFQHARTAQRRANVWTKLKNLRTGQVIEKTFSAGESFDEPDFSERPMQYLYNDGELFHFMDSRSCPSMRTASCLLSSLAR